MKIKKNGFTLVELLAVIVILAIILVIAVPKVMNVIEDSKKATLESTAKLIASTAEKAKIQNTLLGKEETITCKSIAKLNDDDYASCSIVFDDNTAKVTIKGKGKFEGLGVCKGTKTEANAVEGEECPIEVATYITQLLDQESALNNGLIVDDTDDKNIRYAGSNPNNYVYFNCKDEYADDSKIIKYGDADYAHRNNCEKWRIIGIFEVENSKGKIEELVKIVRDESFKDSEGNVLEMNLDTSDSTINEGYGINQWGPSGSYEGADLMRLLNDYYLGTTSTCTYSYFERISKVIYTDDCSSDIIPLSNSAKNMIENAVWNTGAIMWYESKSLSPMYTGERSTKTGKKCSATNADASENLYCNDTVERTTEWLGKIGLIYPSDYAYASADEHCKYDVVGSNSGCSENNWLHPVDDNSDYWTISPELNFSNAFQMWRVDSFYHLYKTHTYSNVSVRPTLYLKSNIQIVGGNGGDEPFILK